jgi:hypothetical protein
VRHLVPLGTVVVESTSDDFFASPLAADLIGPGGLDIAFIDGMHLFEFALRDLVNVARHSHRGTLVIMDDCWPPDPAWASREPYGGMWTGDVWKVLLFLRDEHPEVEVALLDVHPAGLALIRGDLSALGTTDVDGVVARYEAEGFDAFDNDLLLSLDTVTGDFDTLVVGLRHDPYQQWADRDARRARIWAAETSPRLVRPRTMLDLKKAVARTRVGKGLISGRDRLRAGSSAG